MARKTILIILSAVILILALVGGCSDRKSLIATIDVTTGGMSPKNHVFVDELLLQLRNQFQLIQIMLYMPRASFPVYYGGSGAKELPLLLLLPPHGEDAKFYLNHGLKGLADEMISTGEIVPMYIATIPSDPTEAFGGYMYAGSRSFAAGDYDALIGSNLVDYISKTWEYPSTNSELRGIGGVGTGAYGAFRAALVHPGAFSSISVVDGPLDFDGSDGLGNGFEYLMVYAVESEQGGFVDNADLRVRFDSLGSHPVSRMLIGAAMAFSPHDTALDYSWRPHTDASGHSVVLVTIVDSTRGTPGYAIQDTATFITRLITADVDNFDFHLPFDYTGQPHQPIWDLWLDNNLENIMNGNELDGVDIWIATSPEVHYGFHDQTMSWVATLESNGYSPTVVEYFGTPENPATAHQYIFELMRDMLKFHSDNFKANGAGN